jgi:hypothetical protein
MKSFAVFAGAAMFALSTVGGVAHATNLVGLCGKTVTEDTDIDEGGMLNGDCKITVDNARLRVFGAAVNIFSTDDDKGDLEISGAGDEAVLEILFTQLFVAHRLKIDFGDRAQVEVKGSTIHTGDRAQIETVDGDIAFKSNAVVTGDDLRVKPTGTGDVEFKNNTGTVGGDLRLGDDKSNGSVQAKNNGIVLAGELRAQSGNGDVIEVKNNSFGGDFVSVQIVAGSDEARGTSDVSVKNNNLGDAVTAVEITSDDGNVDVKNNSFGLLSGFTATIESGSGQCQSKNNTPASINGACPIQIP